MLIITNIIVTIIEDRFKQVYGFQATERVTYMQDTKQLHWHFKERSSQVKGRLVL